MGAGHSHHEHDIPSRSQSVRRAFVAGVLLNLGFIGVEAMAAWWSDSMALWSDALHNLSDVAGLLISLFAFWLAGIGTRPMYHFGFGKATILAGFFNGLLLIGMAFWLFWASLSRLTEPPPVHGMMVIVTAAAGILINGITAWIFYRLREKEINVRAAFLHMLADALVSAVVLVSAVLAIQSEAWWLDPLAGMLIAVVIFAGSIGVLRKGIRLVLDGVPPGVSVDSIRQELLRVDGVEAIDSLHIWALGSTRYALNARLKLRHDIHRKQEADTLNRLRHEFQHKGFEHVLFETYTHVDAEDYS
jgi:cobalt-zinc-cadmium efflux system protein